LTVIDPTQYESQLATKLTVLEREYLRFNLPNIEVFKSEPTHYRMRAEFRVWHEGEKSFYAMTSPGEKTLYTLEQFPVASELINHLMTTLLGEITGSDILRKRLFSAEFLTTLSGEAVVTLIYHRKLDDEWEATATRLQDALGINIIGRSRKQKIILGREYLLEVLQVNERNYHYQQVEGSFTQPNAGVNQHMLSWAENCSKQLNGDLLELYCGNGNFTCVLADSFDKVLATEVSKVSVRSAFYNLNANHITNVKIARMSSEELTQALNKERAFRRLKDIPLDNYNFSTLFVDPPRAGLDPATEQLATNFTNILYISCNPQTLGLNLETLTKTHIIKRFAVFDQFPYTPHLECGVWLQKPS